MITMTKEERDAVNAVVEYLYDDERKDFEATEPEQHIFGSVRVLQKLLERTATRKMNGGPRPAVCYDCQVGYHRCALVETPACACRSCSSKRRV
jgi:hypothetical protein